MKYKPRTFVFNDWLILVSYKLRNYVSYINHYLIILFINVYLDIYKDIRLELCIGKVFLNKITLNRLDYRPIHPTDYVHGFLFLSLFIASDSILDGLLSCSK